jgi:hypothetical protein
VTGDKGQSEWNGDLRVGEEEQEEEEEVCLTMYLPVFIHFLHALIVQSKGFL